MDINEHICMLSSLITLALNRKAYATKKMKCRYFHNAQVQAYTLVGCVR